MGGPDAKIIPYSRENSSGTYVFFKEHVLENADYTPRAQTMPGTAAVVNAVAKEKFGIGYGGAAYAKGIKVLKIKKDAARPGSRPPTTTIKDGTYPLSRPLFFYLRPKPSAEIKAFTDWVVAAKGRRSRPGRIFPRQIDRGTSGAARPFWSPRPRSLRVGEAALRSLVQSARVGRCFAVVMGGPGNRRRTPSHQAASSRPAVASVTVRALSLGGWTPIQTSSATPSSETTARNL